MLGVRLDAELARRLDAVARSQGRTRSDVVREALTRYLDEDAFLAEARRQSLLVAAAAHDEGVAEFALAVADVAGA